MLRKCLMKFVNEILDFVLVLNNHSEFLLEVFFVFICKWTFLRGIVTSNRVADEEKENIGVITSPASRDRLSIFFSQQSILDVTVSHENVCFAT